MSPFDVLPSLDRAFAKDTVTAFTTEAPPEPRPSSSLPPSRESARAKSANPFDAILSDDPTSAMARIQIPIEALTSRLNISDRIAGVRSVPLANRFSNLRPLGEFFDFKRLSKPASFGEMQSRVNYNLGHFSSNYAVIFAMLSVYALITNWLLLFDIIFVVAGLWVIGRLDGRDLEIGTFRATTSQLYTGLLVIAIPVGLISSPFSTMLWLIGASGVVILGHAALMDKPIDEAFSGEAV